MPETDKRIRRKPKLQSFLGMEEQARDATAALESRPVAPRIRIERTKEGWGFACPYRDEHKDDWTALLFNAFGTRSISVMEHFLDAIASLVGEGFYDDERNCWMPLERDFQAAINIINALDPQDEAQAAYAAQLLALHLSSVKLGAQCSKSYADPRTSAILAKTVRAYGDGMERMLRLQGKIEPKQVNQTIQVVYVDKRSVHFNGGVDPNGGQAHGTAGGAAVSCPALPSPCSNNGQHLSIASGEGQASLPPPWWGSRLWSALRGT